MVKQVANIEFPEFSGIRCLMMPYIQGDVTSLPKEYKPYFSILELLILEEGKIGFLTIDESPVKAGLPHRGTRAKYDRALHTEVGRNSLKAYRWGDGGSWGDSKPEPGGRWGGDTGGRWGSSNEVELDYDVQILLANNLNLSCAIWDTEHPNTTSDGDLGEFSHLYPYEEAIFTKSGEVWQIGILTPHESIPVKEDFNRQFIRIISSGVHGREPYFTENPLVPYN